MLRAVLLILFLLLLSPAASYSFHHNILPAIKLLLQSDQLSPIITITHPDTSQVYLSRSTSMSISGSASDNIDVSVVKWSNDRGGNGICTGTTSWEVNDIQLSSGKNVITVTASDESGNTSTDKLTVIYDAISPEVTISSPTTSPTHTTGSNALSIGGTAFDNVEVDHVSWSNSRGGGGDCTGTTSWFANNIQLSSGQNYITVTVKDKVGNSSTDTMVVNYDITSPTVTITSPTSSPAYTTIDPSLNISGTATDSSGITEVRWSSDSGESGACSGTNFWNASGISLTPGSNFVTVTAEDIFGNITTDNLMVTYDTRRYYLLKRSGDGYRKMWGGWSTHLTGYDYFYQYIEPTEIDEIISSFSNFGETTDSACTEGPEICPCPPYPSIWESGQIDVVAVFLTLEEMESYRCDNPHSGPSYLICNMWVEESQPYPGFWPTINGICGD